MIFLNVLLWAIMTWTASTEKIDWEISFNQIEAGDQVTAAIAFPYVLKWIDRQGRWLRAKTQSIGIFVCSTVTLGLHSRK